jgi:predicted acylesterase/phospholipase RssA
MTFEGRKIAVVLTPGGLPGIEAHAGAWLAMELAGIRPQQLCGCSAGAIVAAAWATGWKANDFNAYLNNVQTKHLIKKRFMWKERLFWIKDFCDPAPMEKRLSEMLPESFSDLKIPLNITATCMDYEPERATRFWHGDFLRQAVRASASIAGVWPYATVDGKKYTDGGTTEAVVLPEHVNDYDLILIVNPCREGSFVDRDRNMISRLLWNFEQLQDREPESIKCQIDTDPAWRNIRWLDLPIGDVSCLEFSEDHDLVDKAFFRTRDWLRDILLEGIQAS